MEGMGRRALLESLKFLSAREVLGVGEVSRLWQELCSSDEVWLALLGEEDNNSRLSLSPPPSLQAAYRLFHYQLYYVTTQQLYCMRVSTLQVSSILLSSPLPAIYSSNSVLIDSNLLFCQCDESFWLVRTKTGGVRELPGLSPPRVCVGLIYLNKCVYGFCGSVKNHASRLCSVLEVKTEQWTDLPESIQPRKALNPVLYAGQVLLANGCCASVESFHLATAQFTLLPIGLTLSSSCLVYRDTLYILGVSDCFIWDLRSYTLTGKKEHMTLDVATCQFPPLVYKNKGYFVYKDSRVLELDLKGWDCYMHSCFIDQTSTN